MTQVLSTYTHCNTSSIAIQLSHQEEDIKKASYAFKAISHPIRLKILCILGNQESNVHKITQAVGTSQSNVSQHLAVLRNKKILISRKVSNRVLYKVADVKILRLIHLMEKVFCQ